MNSLNRLNASLIVPAAMVFVIASPIWGIQEPTSPRITITRIESTPVPTGVGELKTIIPDFSLTASPNGIYAGYGNIRADAYFSWEFPVLLRDTLGSSLPYGVSWRYFPYR